MTEKEKYKAIYRRFRPETFDEVLGQEHVVRVLLNQIAGGSVGHAYLLTGTRGTGKTTIARLLAKGVNCLAGGDNEIPEKSVIRPCGLCSNCNEIKNGTFLDVVEIDAASNNSVDDVRDLRESLIYQPATGRKKVIIIDEVHMFSKGAFNALLKTLEEPPEHMLFILCTTEANKLPATILSRCIKFEFRRVSSEKIAASMKEICKKIGVKATDDAISVIARNADGSVRDGLTLLENCVAAVSEELTRDLVLDVLGSPKDEDIALLTEDCHDGKTAEALVRLNEMLSAGREERRIINDWIDFLHCVLLIKHVNDPLRVINRSKDNINSIKEQTKNYQTGFINESIYRLSKLFNESRYSEYTRVLLEMAVIDICESGAKLDCHAELAMTGTDDSE